MSEKKSYIIIEKYFDNVLKKWVREAFKPLMLTDEEADKIKKEIEFNYHMFNKSILLLEVDTLKEFDCKQHFDDTCAVELRVCHDSSRENIINNEIDMKLIGQFRDTLDFNIITNEKFKKRTWVDCNSITDNCILENRFEYSPLFAQETTLYLLNVPVNINVTSQEFTDYAAELALKTMKFIFKEKFDNDLDKIKSHDWKYYTFNRK